MVPLLKAEALQPPGTATRPSPHQVLHRPRVWHRGHSHNQDRKGTSCTACLGLLPLLSDRDYSKAPPLPKEAFFIMNTGGTLAAFLGSIKL